FRRIVGQQAGEQAGVKGIAAAHAIVHIQFRGRGDVTLSVDPSHRAPTMTISGMNISQRSGENLDLRMFLGYLIDHAEEGAGIELRLRANLGSRNPEALLQVFFVAYQHVDLLYDAPQDLHRAIRAA